MSFFRTPRLPSRQGDILWCSNSWSWPRRRWERKLEDGQRVTGQGSPYRSSMISRPNSTKPCLHPGNHGETMGNHTQTQQNHGELRVMQDAALHQSAGHHRTLAQDIYMAVPSGKRLPRWSLRLPMHTWALQRPGLPAPVTGLSWGSCIRWKWTRAIGCGPSVMWCSKDEAWPREKPATCTPPEQWQVLGSEYGKPLYKKNIPPCWAKMNNCKTQGMQDCSGEVHQENAGIFLFVWHRSW